MNSLFEGVKMEVAMQMPRIHGMGYDPETMPEWGGSFATGFGFGMMNGIVPWNAMYRGVMGTQLEQQLKQNQEFYLKTLLIKG